MRVLDPEPRTVMTLWSGPKRPVPPFAMDEALSASVWLRHRDKSRPLSYPTGRIRLPDLRQTRPSNARRSRISMDPTTSMLSVLANRIYRHLFAAQVIALIGTGLMTVALGLLAFEIAGD